jgi:hypothetical protein
LRPGLETGFGDAAGAVERLGCALPGRFLLTNSHLDPDFSYLTYGDRGERAKQIRSKLGQGDLLVFYASLRDVRSSKLEYGLIGIFRVATIKLAADIPSEERCMNAHTRRDLIGGDDSSSVPIRMALVGSCDVSVSPSTATVPTGSAAMSWKIGEGSASATATCSGVLDCPSLRTRRGSWAGSPSSVLSW